MIKNSICNIKKRRKKLLWLMQNVSNCRIYYSTIIKIDNHIVFDGGNKYLCNHHHYNNIKIKDINLVYFSCGNLCISCFRETSRCKLIHTRKLMCWKILLSQKFPKDIIRLITKKVK